MRSLHPKNAPAFGLTGSACLSVDLCGTASGRAAVSNGHKTSWKRHPAILVSLFAAVVALAFSDAGFGADEADGLEFFEQRIRPVLIEHCYECHSAGSKSLKGGLRLDTRESSRAGGDSGAAVVPKDVAGSLLIGALRQEAFEMPPNGPLPATVIADFERWIATGADDPREETKPQLAAFDLESRRRDHWAWQSVKSINVPGDGTLQPIDALVRQRLQQQGLEPASLASPRILIRRLKFDLLGLPPTIEEIARFLGDDSQTAWASLVDQWLNDPRFGEKWASHWLDVMRYSETKGHVTDHERPYAWKYRDYLIDALNDDVPYDRLIIEHLAGDLLPPGEHRPGRDGRTRIAPTATGALFTHEMHFMAVDPVRQRWDEIDAQIDTVGKAFLGLTIGCARCHDHKFDAISQADYYALAGFFYSTEQGRLRTGPREILAPDQMREVAKFEAEYEQFIAAKIRERRKAQSPKAEDEFPISEELGVQGPAAHGALMQKMKRLEEADPSWGRWVRAAKDVAARDAPLLIRGDHHNHGELQPRRFLTALSREDSEPIPTGSGRLWLARQIASEDNPLTARVCVNRLWHHLFGRGIVSTPNNFGKLGAAPTHPELLDDLAVQLIQNGWSTKAVIRQIVLSETYRQVSDVSDDSLRADPQNQWLAHQNRRRLSAESIRDSVLFVSGQLDLTIFGPGIPIYVPPYATANKAGNVPKSGPLDGAGRRSLYLTVRRNFSEPMLQTFDFPNRGKSVGARTLTTVPSQSLAMLNGPFVREQAIHWASRFSECQDSTPEIIARMFEQSTGRVPDPDELEVLMDLAATLKNSTSSTDDSREELLRELAHVLLNLDEFQVVE